MMMNEFQNLNEAQKRAVDCLDGPLLVLAGAGAGKTKTITYRILNLIKHGVDPSDILAITFTNKAAQEMKERVEGLLQNSKELNRPSSINSYPFVSTFHKLGAFIIKENYKILGTTKHFSIYDREDSKRAVKESLEKNSYNPKEFEPGKILAVISREKGNFVSATEYSERIFEGGENPKNSFSSRFNQVIANVWQDYEKILNKEKAFDFDDLLLVATKLLQDEEVRKKYSERWKYVHIDEYQDTNKVQYKIAESITRDHQNICAVGDIDQNIYSWRGANIKNIMNFEKDYKNAEVVILEENYRSTKTIIEIANKIIEKNKFRKDKKLTTKNAMGERVGVFEAVNETHEAQFVAEKIKELTRNGLPHSEIAILYRANFQSRAIEEALLSKEIPYQVLGTKFFDRKEVKDIISFLRFSMNPESISDLKRIINLPTRGIGKTTLLKIVEGREEDLPPKIKMKLQNFREMVARIKNFALNNPPSKTILFIAKESGLLENLEKTEEGKERIENIKELSALASRYDKINEFQSGGEVSYEDSIEKLIEDTSLVSDQDSEKNQDSVRVMTVHASKGLEFSTVFVTGMEEGLFPYDKDGSQNIENEESEEERRLFYVALTRAKKKLFLTYTEYRTIFGNRSVNIPSEFLLEIPEEYLEKEFLDFTPKRKPLLHIEF